MTTLEIWRAAITAKAEALGMSADEAISLAVYAFANGNPLLDSEKLKPFKECSELTGKSVEDLVETAMGNYAECDLAVLVEELAECTNEA
jgi:hypothetical protein